MSASKVRPLRCHRPFYKRDLVHNHRRPPGNLGIEPGHIARIHVNAAVTAVVVEGGCAVGRSRVGMGEVVPWAIDTSPPAIVEEVAARMVLHGVLDRRGRIPEGRAGWFARFEDGRMLTQDDAPEARRRWLGVLAGDYEKCPDQFIVVVETQRLLDQRDYHHLAGMRAPDAVMLHEADIRGVRLIPGGSVVEVGL